MSMSGVLSCACYQCEKERRYTPTLNNPALTQCTCGKQIMYMGHNIINKYGYKEPYYLEVNGDPHNDNCQKNNQYTSTPGNYAGIYNPSLDPHPEQYHYCEYCPDSSSFFAIMGIHLEEWLNAKDISQLHKLIKQRDDDEPHTYKLDV